VHRFLLSRVFIGWDAFGSEAQARRVQFFVLSIPASMSGEPESLFSCLKFMLGKVVILASAVAVTVNAHPLAANRGKLKRFRQN
jgi:hypothetical protein